MKPKIISLVGITASGKSALGIKLAQEFNGEIVSCDSRQIYEGLDLGSGKVTKQEQAIVPHHLLDICPPGKTFNVFEFQKLAYAAIDDILARGKLPILVGGSGLYSRSIVEGYVFASEAKQPLHENKPRYDVLQICIMPPREVIEPLVIKRIQERLDEGMIEETAELVKQGTPKEWFSSLGLEYFWNVLYIEGKINLDEYKRLLKDKVMQFIKRQRTWFRKEKNTIYLTDPSEFHKKSRELIQKFLNIELIDIFDKDMNHIGVMEKWEAHRKNQMHKNSHIWVTDGKNVLIQLRSPKKKILPNKWDISAAGHFGLGDTPLECAKREYEEELGLSWEFGDVEPNLVKAWEGLCNGVPLYEFIYFFFVKGKPDISKAKLQREEVVEVKWLPFEEFKKQIKTDLFCPFDDEYWEIVVSGLSKLID